jgi:putative hemolysin
MNSRWHWLLAAVTAGALLAACQRAPETPPAAPGPGIANPASVYCAGLGYVEETRENPDGQYGVCIFPDGTECDSWALFRGECGLDKTYCAQQGYTPEVRDGVLTCVFPDGSTCPEFDYFSGTCAPSS